MAKRVAVLMGGWSAEREVSLSSGRECAKALETAGYEVIPVDVRRDLGALLTELTPGPDVIFNALHGKGGEDGVVQGVLEFLQVPYTHSGVLASALAMDKQVAKQVMAAAGIPVPAGVVVSRDEVLRGHPIDPPYVVKPVDEGSSVGISFVMPGDNLPGLDPKSWVFGDRALVESYVAGRELTVAVMGDRPMAVTEIKPLAGFYDYEAKYTDGKAVHDVPADIPAPVYEECLRLALLAHRCLGCSGVSRADYRYDDSRPGLEGLFMLEVNTQPGMTPLSLVPEQAAHLGIEFPELCAWMVENAACHV
ncbi:MAG: D-alanine--D-alanine ligase [Inquilinus sp.]|nr:D-alanine--D-alanine ligase [Inquilinus sp.]